MRTGIGTRGSSILEALWATVVIGVGALGLALLSQGLLHGNRQSQLTAAAAAAVQEEMEHLLAGAPLNLSGDLGLGDHPPSAGPALRYQGLDRYGQVAAPSVAAASAGYESLRHWSVTDASTTRCLRRVRVSVWNPAATSEVARAEVYVNCP